MKKLTLKHIRYVLWNAYNDRVFKSKTGKICVDICGDFQHSDLYFLLSRLRQCGYTCTEVCKRTSVNGIYQITQADC